MNSNAELFSQSSQWHSDSTMKLMLDASDIVRELEVFLRGYYIESYYDEDMKKVVNNTVSLGEPKCNEKGVQYIRSWLRMKYNPLVTLSNIDEDRYLSMLAKAQENLARNLMTNLVNYDIPLKYYEEIVDLCMDSFEAILSSAINGGHRRSFTRNQSVETKEYVEKEKKNFLGVI